VVLENAPPEMLVVVVAAVADIRVAVLVEEVITAIPTKYLLKAELITGIGSGEPFSILMGVMVLVDNHILSLLLLPTMEEQIEELDGVQAYRTL
jgi:hypothetical protein